MDPSIPRSPHTPLGVQSCLSPSLFARQGRCWQLFDGVWGAMLQHIQQWLSADPTDLVVGQFSRLWAVGQGATFNLAFKSLKAYIIMNAQKGLLISF